MSKTCLKRGRLIGSKDKNPWKRKKKDKETGTPEEIRAPKEAILPEQITSTKTLEVVQVPENTKNIEISINYVNTGKQWNCDKIVVDNVFAYEVALDIMKESKDFEPKSVEEFRRRNDWPK